MNEQIQPKMILSEEGKIILILSNPQQTKHKPIQEVSFGRDYTLKNGDKSSDEMETDAGDDTSSFKISLEVITLFTGKKRHF